MPLSIVVLAAGQGRRMRSSLPKVLQPLAGRPLLAHVLDLAESLDPQSVHVVYGHGGGEVQAAFANRDLSWCHQAEQLGTGHAVAQAMPAIPDANTTLILCGDVPLLGRDILRELLAASDGAGVALLTARMDDPSGYGRILRSRDDGVSKIVEQKDASTAELEIDEINTGVLTAPAGKLRTWLERLDNNNSQGEYYLTDVIALATADGVRVTPVLIDDAEEAMGINDKLQLATAERKFQRRAADELMLSGATLADPERIDIRGDLSVGSDVFIDVGAVFVGAVELGQGCQIGSNVVIKDAKLGAGTTVHANSVIDQAKIGAGCEIGPFARIRPGSCLAEKVKIGNFVETKNSEIATGSKVNHLSYIGDSTVGSAVNVGAGTITCNYDGANKHRTTIGDRVAVGSNVNFVAPVEIGADATIGAGSTVTKNAPAGELTVARARQTTVEGWQRPQKKPKPAD